MATARIGADAEPADSVTGGPLRFSLGFSESLNTRTARPSSTTAMRNP
jgi:hypothetical protein